MGNVLRPTFPDHEAQELEEKRQASEWRAQEREALRRWRKTREWESRGKVWCPPCPVFSEPRTNSRWCVRCGWPQEVHCLTRP